MSWSCGRERVAEGSLTLNLSPRSLESDQFSVHALVQLLQGLRLGQDLRSLSGFGAGA